MLAPMSEPVLIRPVQASDAPALLALADLLDTVNLPDDPAAIAGIIRDSERSFAALASATLPAGFDAKHAGYTLVAVQDGRLLGTGSLFAFHGMPDEPHYFLRVEEQVVHSRQLNADRSRHLLKLGKDTEPWTEFGGLVVHPESRGQGVGKLLVAARLALVAMHPTRFCRRLLAELLPPRREDGSNAFWDAVGAPLTGLTYYRADLLCRTDKEFIEAFFPHEELLVELLPPEARELIGKEGPATTPVRALLARAGFRHLGTVDPFDAGPHDGVEVKDCAPIQRARRAVRLDLPPGAAAARELVGSASGHVFAAVPCEMVRQGLRLAEADAARLGIAVGDECWVLPLAW
jgi:arginine N-succinyltransferase